MSALRVLVGGFDKPSATVRHLAQVAPLVVIGARMANELEAELGSAQAVALTKACRDPHRLSHRLYQSVKLEQ